MIVVALTAHSCFKDTEDRHFRIPFTNNTEKRLIVDANVYYNWNPPLGYLDTLLHPYDPDPSSHNPGLIVEPYEENKDALFQFDAYEYDFLYYDTLMIFVFDADTLEALGWDTVRENYIVLQRYDLSLEDLQYLGFRLCFPPDEKMKHIHMWPPYGTYDQLGRKKD